MTRPQDDPVGGVGEEAAKLLGALADWAGDRAKEVDEHLATGDAECLYCPICRTVHAVRDASPEVRAQLVSAASTFLQAAAGLLSAAGSQPASSRVQHIDLDDEDGTDEDGTDEDGTDEGDTDEDAR